MAASEIINGWENFDFKTFIGRDIEQSEPRNIYRGPVSRFAIKHDLTTNLRTIYIYVKWLAVNIGADRWHLLNISDGNDEELCSCAVNMAKSFPYSTGRDIVNLVIPHLANVIFLPPGDNLRKEGLI